MGLAEAMKARIAGMEKKVVDTEKELCEAESRDSKVEGEFPEQKERMDALSNNVIHLAMKLGEISSCAFSMHQKMTDVHHGEA